MTGGLRGTASLLAIAALFCVGATVFGAKPAKAADLGGDCCADLEERVADLEATTVRKGNKKVSVQIYGKMNRAVLFWDDGAEKNTYVVNNGMESTRTGIKGSAKIANDWSAGFRLEWEYREALSQTLNQFNDNNTLDAAGSIVMRWSQIYLASKTYGTANLGLTATPKYDITKDTMEYISTVPGEGGGLSDTLVPDFRMNDSMRLRPTGFNTAEGLSSLAWQNIARCYSANDQFNCSTRRNGASYNSPVWKGFSTQWGWFEDDDWGGAVRYRNVDWNDTWMVAASVGYENLRDERLQNGGGGDANGIVPIPSPNETTGKTTDKITFFERNFDEWAGSAAIKHKPTGLFVMGVFSTSETSDTNAIGFFNGKRPPEMNAWNVQGGIQRKIGGLGAFGDTAFWGGFSQVNDGFAQGSNGGSTTNVCVPGDSPSDCSAGGNLGVAANGILKGKTFANILVPTQITGSEVDSWFLALDQSFEAAAFHLYAAYEHFDGSVDLVTRCESATSCTSFGKLRRVPESIDDFDLFYTGGRLYF